MAVEIRPAVEGDGAAIKALVRANRVNPRNILPSRFLVAEEAGRVVGIQQVKVHEGGTREVASRVVDPKFRLRGIGTELMRAMLAEERGTLYLQCNEAWIPYYERFGFRRVSAFDLPPDLHKQHRIAKVVVAVRQFFVRRRLSVVPMKREAQELSVSHLGDEEIKDVRYERVTVDRARDPEVPPEPTGTKTLPAEVRQPE